MIGQISIFDLLPEQGIPAECLCNYITERRVATPVSSEAKRLIPDGKYQIMVDNHVLVLRPTKLDREGVPKGLEFCHYFIEGPVYWDLIGNREIRKVIGNEDTRRA